MQKHVNLVDLVKSFPTNILLQNLASIQKKTSPVKFAHLAEKSGKGSISNLSTKVSARWQSCRATAREALDVNTIVNSYGRATGKVSRRVKLRTSEFRKSSCTE